MSWCTISHAVRRGSVAGSQSAGSSPGLSRRTLPPLDRRMPASTMPPTLVFLAFESVSATPYSPSAKPDCSNHARAQRLSASKSPSCSASASSRVWLISARAFRTVSGLPSASSTLGVAGIDRHARADSRLRQVHRGDVAALEMRERYRQLGFECGKNSRRVAVAHCRDARAANEDDTGGEGVRADAEHDRLPVPYASAKCRSWRTQRGSPRRGMSPSRCSRTPRSLSRPV